jgi:malate dehydrogenase (oxaloacetate-decarboxylating)
VNLEDVRLRVVFEIEARFAKELNIPVIFMMINMAPLLFISTALRYRPLKLVKKPLSQVRIVISGAGAAGGQAEGRDGCLDL